MPNFIKRQREAAAPPANKEVTEARALLQSSAVLVLRGASAAEQPETDAWRRRAVANALLTSYVRSREAPLYRKRDPATVEDGLPRYCIALSGGGMRSLAFGAGVLHGLKQRGWYDHVAVLSAVSGGGYATYWMAGNVRRGATEEQLLSGSASQQLTRLRQHASALVSPVTPVEFLFSQMGSAAATQQPNQNAGRRLADEILGPIVKSKLGLIEWRMAGGHVGYTLALDRMLTVSGRRWVAPPVSWRRLEELVGTGRIPLPVWSATARPSDALSCVGSEPGKEIAERGRPLGYAAFEMGPTRFGSEQLGFLSHTFLSPLDAMAVSAAGMAVPYNERCALLQSIADASIAVDNYPAGVNPTDAREAQPRSSPGESFVLTDGGIADNLGVFPLVRRLCSDIIVVDAEFDPYLVFEGYGYLKQQLANLDVRLEIPELEAVALRNRVPSVPANPDVPCYNGICLIRPRPECVRREIAADCVSADHLPAAVYEGELGPIPFAMLSGSGTAEQHWDYSNRVLRIHYIKLSLDASRIERYPKTVRDRYASHADRRKVVAEPCVTTRDNNACSFPYEPTANLDYRDGEFEAYWDLGRCIVESNWPDPSAGNPAGSCSESQW